MVLGSSQYLWPGFLFSIFVFTVVASPLRNATNVPSNSSTIDRIWIGNESSYNTQIRPSSTRSAGLWQICQQSNDSWLWILRNGSNLTLEAFGTNKQKKESAMSARLHLCCSKDKRLQNGIHSSDCDTLVVVCGIDLPANHCQASCPSEKERSHDFANER